jgi:hypothetical protein
MRKWLIENALSSESEISQIEIESKLKVKQCRQTAWDNYLSGNGSSGLFNFGSFSANLAVLKDNIQYSNVKLF